MKISVDSIDWRIDRKDTGIAVRPLLEKGGSDSLFVQLVRLKPGSGFSPHVHQTQESVYFILCGSAEVILDGEHQSLQQNDFVYIPCNTVHGIANRSGVACVYLETKSPSVDSPDG